jgi:hypothetical protein
MSESTMPLSKSMAQKNNLMTIIDRWPMALIGFGFALTLVWAAFLSWFLLYLLQLA